MNPTTPQADTHSRVSGLLIALSTIAAELGPLFLHSEHGQNLLQTSILVVSSLAKTLEPNA